jgi:alpha-mannosidase
MVETGPVRCKIQIKREYNQSRFIQNIILYTRSNQVDFEISIDWHERQKFAKISFPLNLSSTYATYDIPYGSIQRFDHTLEDDEHKLSMPERRWEEADKSKFEVAALKWMDVTSESGEYGVSLFNDCKHGFSFEKSTMRMSLVRGPRRGFIQKMGKQIVMLDEWSDQSDMPIVGEHFIKYSIYTHQGDWKTSGVPRKAYEFNYPFITRTESVHKGDMPQNYSFIEVKPQNIILTTVKKAEDSEATILRMYEASNKDTEATIIFDTEPKTVTETDLMEWGKYVEEKNIPVEAKHVKFQIKANEIKTLKVEL